MATSYTYKSGGQTYTATPNATATPQQISSGASYLQSKGATPITSQTQAISNALNPRDAPGYIPGSLPGDNPSGGVTTPIDTSQPSPEKVEAGQYTVKPGDT